MNIPITPCPIYYLYIYIPFYNKNDSGFFFCNIGHIKTLVKSILCYRCFQIARNFITFYLIIGISNETHTMFFIFKNIKEKKTDYAYRGFIS